MNFLFNVLVGGEIVRFIGVCFLFLLGRVVSKINPGRKTYSFKAIWDMRYDKGDDQARLMESTGQKITGFMVIGGILLILSAVL